MFSNNINRKMSKIIYQFSTLILSVLFIQFAVAQENALPIGNWKMNKGTGQIKGAIVNALGEGVEFSAISLFLQESNQLVDGTITDEKGRFELINLGAGTYRIEISFLGYDDVSRPDLILEEGQKLDIGNVSLEEKAEFLDEVTVTAEKSLIEEQVDRTVYNASKDLLSRGGDAADVLRKVPLLQVDLDGNVSIRGSSNIRVLINNKPSTIMAASVADALKMLPSEMIDKVEVITSPSAKYDAEGSGGIINIITKRNDIAGHYLQINTGLGLRGSNLGLNGSYRKGKFGMTLGGFGRAFYNDAETSMTQITRSGNSIRQSEQSSEASDNGLFGRYNLGFDYDIDKTQFLSGGIRYGLRNFSRDQLQTTELYTDNVLQFSNLRDIESARYSGSIDLNVDYLKVFKPQQELSISTLYSRSDDNNNFVSDNLTSDLSFINSLKNLDDNMNRELTLQVDFATPIGSKQKFEIGAKGILRKVNSQFSYLFAETPGNFATDFNRPAGTLDYDQDVAAAYTTYSISFPGDYTIKAGVRYEKTIIEAFQNEEFIDIPDYQNLVPSVNMSKKIGQVTTLKFGFNQRIQRPWLRQLNPNINVENSQDIQVGNPRLRPELTNNLELGVSTMIKKTFINISVFNRTSDNAINTVRYPATENGAIITTFDNIGKEKAYGTDLFLNVNLSDKVSINGGINMQYLDLEGQVTGLDGTSVTASNSGFNYGGRLMSQIKLNGGWSLQAFSFMHGKRVELQGSRGGYGMYALGFNKDFNNKKGSIGVSVENFASRGWKVNSELVSPIFSQSSTNYLLNRSVRVNFNYRIGKMDIGADRKKTKSVNNSDLMGGGDNMGGGDMGGGTQPATAPQQRPAGNGPGQQRSGGKPGSAADKNPNAKKSGPADASKKPGEGEKKSGEEKPVKKNEKGENN